MTSVLFIPINSIQAELFGSIVDVLGKLNIQSKFICMDSIYKNRYPNYLVEPVLSQLNLSFNRLETYGSISPTDIIKIEKPDLIINCQDAMEPTIRMFMMAAEKQHIPGLVLQDAFMFKPQYSYFSPEQYPSDTLFKKVDALIRDIRNFPTIFSYGCDWGTRLRRVKIRLKDIVSGKSLLWGNGVYNKIAVMGEYTKNLLLERGVEPSKIVITGQPRWDKLVLHNPYYDKKHLIKKYKLDPEKKTILLTTQPLVESKMWSENDREYYIISIINSIAHASDLNLIIKLHPRDNRFIYEKIIAEHVLQNKCVILQNEDIFELYQCTDLLLTHICTTALEAMIMDIPVIAVDFKYSTSNIIYVAKRAALGVDHPDQLLPCIKKLLTNNSTLNESLRSGRRNFIYECAYIQDGKATQRVAELIIKMIKENNNRM